jgi:hypothetical protein
MLCMSGLISSAGEAQALPQTAATQTQVSQALSPEILAMHARLKRPSAMSKDLESAAAR